MTKLKKMNLEVLSAIRNNPDIVRLIKVYYPVIFTTVICCGWDKLSKIDIYKLHIFMKERGLINENEKRRQ